MSCEDRDWHKMVRNAKLQQQEYYELLPEWTKYRSDEHKYLWQNIGFALFGPPLEDEGGNVALQDKCEITDGIDVTTAVQYDPEAKKIIDAIYRKVCEYGDGFVEKDIIYYGLIYNITFRVKNVPGDTANSKKDSKNKEADLGVYPIPIFKIKRHICQTDGILVQVWYIDTQGRIYKSWNDYKESNTLPQCTMVFPKNGIYEPDPNYEITEESSIVLIDVAESPACNISSVVANTIDKVSSVTGVVGLGLCVASLFTPAAPLTLGATVISGVNGLWVLARSTQNLVDRHSHEESISLANKTAFCSWLAISGSTFGLASSGGAALLTKLVKSGTNISTVAKVAYNVVLVGNLGINFVGVAFQAYCLYEKYQEDNTIAVIDTASLAAHILFLGNAVVNLQFAGELIETTQGKVLDDYRATLRSKHLRRQFNRTKRNAAANHADKASENAEVIRYINRKAEFNIKYNSGNISKLKSSVLFKNGKTIINGITLLDPMKFVDMLINFDRTNSLQEQTNNDSEGRYLALRKLLEALLKDLFSKCDKKKTRVPHVDEFNAIFNDIKCINNGLNIFPLIFKISITLIERCLLSSEYLEKSVYFVWNYVKESLRQTCSETFSIFNKDVQEGIDKIILVLFEHMEKTATELKPAFKKYISNYLRKSHSQYFQNSF